MNLVPPAELLDQHLFAEWREIKMVPQSLARSLQAWGLPGVLNRVPPTFRLGTGHVSFFYDKGAYLHQRFEELGVELHARGVQYNREAVLDRASVYATLPPAFHRGYTPTPAALAEVRARIADRVAARPGWYRYRGAVAPNPPQQRG
jgi:deoxyribonuclease (pyrimidine dimer)